jgi:hypothetical protein
VQHCILPEVKGAPLRKSASARKLPANRPCSVVRGPLLGINARQRRLVHGREYVQQFAGPSGKWQCCRCRRRVVEAARHHAIRGQPTRAGACRGGCGGCTACRSRASGSKNKERTGGLRPVGGPPTSRSRGPADADISVVGAPPSGAVPLAPHADPDLAVSARARPSVGPRPSCDVNVILICHARLYSTVRLFSLGGPDLSRARLGSSSSFS